MSDRPPSRRPVAADAERVVTFPRAAWAGLAIAGVLLVGGILTQIALLEDQRETARDQRAILDRQFRETLPLIRSTRPLVRETRPFVREAREAAPEARRAGRRVARLATAAQPLVEELRRAGLSGTARAVEQVADTLLDADLVPTMRAARALAAEVLRTNPAETIDDIESATDSVPYMTSVLRRSLLVQQASLRAQRQSVSLQKQTVATAREQAQLTRDLKRTADETLAVARETERHAESVDRKLGGPLPGANP